MDANISDSLNIEGDASFAGSNPIAFRIDQDGSLQAGSAPLPSGVLFPTDATPVISLHPLYFNAPEFFVGQGKPIAYCKIGATQENSLAPLKTPLSWSIVYSLIVQVNQNLQSTEIAPGSDASKIEDIALPGGRGQLWCEVMAIVDGDPGKGLQIIESTFQKLQTLAGGTAVKGLFSIPAAPLAVAGQVESLLQQVTQAFSPGQRAQYWINSNLIELIASASQLARTGASNGAPSAASSGAPSAGASAGANFSQISIAAGTTTVVITPAAGNPGDGNAVKDDQGEKKPFDYFGLLTPFVNSPVYRFGLGGQGDIRMTKGPSGAANPFLQVPYVTMNIQTANQQQGGQTS